MTAAHSESIAGTHPRIPDLEIDVRLAGTGTLVFEVHSPDPAQGINSAPMRGAPLGMPPEGFVNHLFRDIEKLRVDTAAARQIAEQRLAVKGLAIWALFPDGLQELLWKRRRQILTVLIQSEEPYIPWEIAKLQGRRRNGQVVAGPFLCEAFAVTRWIKGNPHQVHLPLRNLAMVIPRASGLSSTGAEREDLARLAASHGREVTDIEPTFAAVVRAMAAGGPHDAWHFAGHAAAIGDDANRWTIRLEEPPDLAAEDLLGDASHLGRTRPLVFLNACATGRMGLTLTGLGGWSSRLLAAGAGAFIGTSWSVPDSQSRSFAEYFYRSLLNGMPIGKAFRKARLDLHRRYPGDPTWLAYTIFAHPLATSVEPTPDSSAARPPERRQPQLKVPDLRWRRDVDPPGALLRAQYGVVPFHHRKTELADLLNWCRDAAPAKVRLYTGPGGMGKTRLALEGALWMRREGWVTGFVTSEAMLAPEMTWRALARPERKLLMIVDYAETHRPFLIPVLREMHRQQHGTVRLLLLARGDVDWWEQLQSERDGVGELITGPATSRCRLLPLADSLAARAESYELAAKAFSEHLGQPLPGESRNDLDDEYFERVLLLHMSALIDIEGREKAEGIDGVLDRVLARERSFWRERAAASGLVLTIVPGIGRALAAITLGGGVNGEAEAVEVMRGLRFFADQPAAVLISIAHLLHGCYPGERWIEPIQPDLLGEHLARRELEHGADELLDLVLGPRSDPMSSGPA